MEHLLEEFLVRYIFEDSYSFIDLPLGNSNDLKLIKNFYISQKQELSVPRTV